MKGRTLYPGVAVTALCAALQLLNDPSQAVHDEARMLILDHADGAHLVTALGLVDDESGEPED